MSAKRIYKSGAQKRKDREKKSESCAKLPKITSFYKVPIPNPVHETVDDIVPSTSTEIQNADRQHDVVTEASRQVEENRDDDQEENLIESDTFSLDTIRMERSSS